MAVVILRDFIYAGTCEESEISHVSRYDEENGAYRFTNVQNIELVWEAEIENTQIQYCAIKVMFSSGKSMLIFLQKRAWDTMLGEWDEFCANSNEPNSGCEVLDSMSKDEREAIVRDIQKRLSQPVSLANSLIGRVRVIPS